MSASAADMRDVLTRILDRRGDGAEGGLSAGEASGLLGDIVDGAMSAAQIGAVLMALRARGETVDELVGAARAMRARARAIGPIAGPLVDTCGTGGDGRGTVNVSTLAAFIAAATGLRVAKHGNRAASSRAGSADVLEALGVGLDPGPEVVVRCIEESGLGFLFAPAYHPATRAVVPIRRELGVRTIFNLLGPLTNPLGPTHQVVGVWDPAWLEPVATALVRLGAERVLVVHGEGGLDELAPQGQTAVVEASATGLRRHTWSARSFGLKEVAVDGLGGGEPADNAVALRRVLSGEGGAARTSALMTAAAARHLVTGEPLERCAEVGGAAIDSGAALAVLERLIARTGGSER